MIEDETGLDSPINGGRLIIITYIVYIFQVNKHCFHIQNRILICIYLYQSTKLYLVLYKSTYSHHKIFPL